MKHEIPFQVHEVNTFKSNAAIHEIKHDFSSNKIPYFSNTKTLITKEMYEFFVNGSPIPLRTKLICKEDELESSLTLVSDHKFDFPKVDFDQHIAYGQGCGGDDTQYVFDFVSHTVYIVGSDITDSLGKKP